MSLFECYQRLKTDFSLQNINIDIKKTVKNYADPLHFVPLQVVDDHKT